MPTQCTFQMRCRRLHCPYQHPNRFVKLCVFYSKGHCKNGRHCPFRHLDNALPAKPTNARLTAPRPVKKSYTQTNTNPNKSSSMTLSTTHRRPLARSSSPPSTPMSRPRQCRLVLLLLLSTLLFEPQAVVTEPQQYTSNDLPALSLSPPLLSPF